MKRITILGSTGSIGRSTLEVIKQNSEQFRAVALTAGRNIDLFERQIKSFRPEIVAVADKKTAAQLHRRVKRVEILAGEEGISAVASYEDSDFVVSAIVGSAGLVPTLAAIRAGRSVGLANKETLVVAGEIVMREARRNGVKIIPIDSEHCAVFQCLAGYRKSEIRRIILTASGGPFFNRRKEELVNIGAEDALKHPNWSMGRKITIDSATLMNKGFEVIEACWLFGVSPEKVDVLIHPQSIVHSMVEFRDRGCLAQMSVPDMRGPIAYALSYPRRLNDPIRGLELDRIESLTFRKPDTRNFPCLSYAYEAIRSGGTMPTVLNAANEVAVKAFLDDRIRFNDIPVVIRKTIDGHIIKKISSLEDILVADGWARRAAASHIRRLKG
jgi:1-deoxy-D-xylulose-5-phosphate reductoisomerase